MKNPLNKLLITDNRKLITILTFAFAITIATADPTRYNLPSDFLSYADYVSHNYTGECKQPF